MDNLTPEEPQIETQEAPEVAAPAWSPDDEVEARAFGWKPDSEWVGDKAPGHISSPVEWMERVKRSKTFSTLSSRLEERERQAQEESRRLAAVNEAALRLQRETYERQLADLNARQRAAVEVADVDTWDNLERQKQALSKAETPPPPVAEPPSAVVEYRRANEWTANPLLWGEAVQAVNYGMQTGAVGADPEAQIKFAEQMMRQKYPHLFQPKEKPVTRPAPVEAGGLAARPATAGFNALPQEARSAFSRFVNEGLFKDNDEGRKAFMEMYNA